MNFPFITNCEDQVMLRLMGENYETELSDEVKRIAVMHGYDLDGEHKGFNEMF